MALFRLGVPEEDWPPHTSSRRLYKAREEVEEEIDMKRENQTDRDKTLTRQENYKDLVQTD